MTRAEKILSLLRERPMTFEELQQLSGVEAAIVRNTLSDLKRSGYTEAVPTTYRITEKAGESGKPKIEWKAFKARQGGSETQKRPGTRKAPAGLVASAIAKYEGSALFNLGRSQL
jgi:DNA-binding transcriptional ArsR family regulator